MSARATGWVWDHQPFRGRWAQMLVHLAIADVVNDARDNEFFMSTERLAGKAGVSRATVVATLSEMVRCGLLEVLQPGGASRRPTRYRFACPHPDDVRSTVDLTSPTNTAQLGQPLGANLEKNPIEEPKGASATVGLVGLADRDCVQCQGRGFYFHAGIGCDRPCECTQRAMRAGTAAR